jgi:hypothetical protein
MNSLGLGEFSIDIEEFNAEWTLNAFDKIWKDRLYWRSWLYDANNEKIKQLNRSMEKFDALLRTE